MTIDEWRGKLERLGAKLPEALGKGLARAGAIVRNEAVEKHLSGPKMPRGVGDEENATLQPQTGFLRGSMQYQVKTREDGAYVVVFNNVEYARKHEEGKGVPKRPFLKPSLNKKLPEAVDAIRKGVVEALHD